MEARLLRSVELFGQKIPMTDNIQEIKIKELEKQLELSSIQIQTQVWCA